MARKIVIPVVTALLLSLHPAPAPASFHLMKIVEVFAGTSDSPTAQYVTLQMYAAGQNFVGGHPLLVYDANGTLLGTFTFPDRVASGTNLATILIATSDAETVFGVQADLLMDPVIPAGGGAVCWDVVDCVAWGTFSAPAALPTSPGTPFNAPEGLVADMAMHRDLSSGGAVTAFVFAAPAPQNNAGETGAPVATPMPTATATPEPTAVCAGDCDGSRDVTINEIILLIDIAFGDADVSACMPGIPSGTTVSVTLIVQAVNSALSGCGPSPEEEGCLSTGGTVSTSLCCADQPDFPDLCAIGPCGCSPASSREVSVCDCGEGACFDRTQRACVPR